MTRILLWLLPVTMCRHCGAVYPRDDDRRMYHFGMGCGVRI